MQIIILIDPDIGQTNHQKFKLNPRNVHQRQEINKRVYTTEMMQSSVSMALRMTFMACGP